jgi:hypothetical protein
MNPLQLHRGTDATRAVTTFATGEPIYCTDTKKMWVGDGTTAGGIPVSLSFDWPATVSATEVGYLDGVTSAIQTQFTGKVSTTGDETIGGNKTFSGYTKLGSDNPLIKIKKLTGITNSSQGAATSVSHGISSSKIISVNVIVFLDSSTIVCHGLTYISGYNFGFSVDSTNLNVSNTSGNSANILSKAFTATIVYEE